MSHARLTPPRVVRRETLVRGRRFDFEEVELLSAEGRSFTRQHIRHPGAVCVLPLLERPAGRVVVFVRNFRASLGEYLLELPAGTLEPNEDPTACAARELIEETGYKAATLREIGRFHTSPGLSDELMWAYVATGLEWVGQALEEDEVLLVEERPAKAALTMIQEGGLTDAKSMLTLLLAEQQGRLGDASH